MMSKIMLEGKRTKATTPMISVVCREFVDGISNYQFKVFSLISCKIAMAV
jgi:hypothetical protein